MAKTSDKAPVFIMNANVPATIERTSEIQVMPIGEWKGKVQNGEVMQFKIDENATAQMVQNFNALGRDIVIDYEHQTLTGDEAPAAGWIKQLINRGSQGLWAMVEWTDRALNYLRNKEYRFLSPVFALEGLDAITGKKIGAVIWNAALTNDPFFSELKPIVSKTDSPGINAGAIFLTQEEHQMKKVIARLLEIYKLVADASEDVVLAKLEEHINSTNAVIVAKGKLVTVLGLKAEATPDEIEAAVVTAKTAGTAVKANMSKIAEAIGLKADASFEEIQAAVVTAKGGSTELPKVAARLQLLETKDTDREFNRIIDAAFIAGKILPTTKTDKEWIAAQREFAVKNMPAFEAFWAKQAVVGPVQKLPEAGVGAKGGDLTETDLIVGKALQVSPDQLKKYNPVAN